MRVYVVFDADGYECKSFVGVFSTQVRAEEAASALRARATAEFDAMKLRFENPNMEDARSISVEPVELDAELEV